MATDETTPVMVQTAETAVRALTLIQSSGAARRAFLKDIPPEDLSRAVLSMAGIAAGLAEALGDLGGPSADRLIGGYTDRYRHVLATGGECRCTEMCGPLAAAIKGAGLDDGD